MGNTDSRESDRDISAIRALIARQFSSLRWSSGQQADWPSFAADLRSDAQLFPAARPVRPQSVSAFVERMKALAGATLHSFEQTMLGAEIHVFGNVAVALASCENLENEATRDRGVEAMLLIKDDGVWQIAAQAWDRERPDRPVPDYLLD